MQSVALADLPLPAMREGERQVKISRDPRQALCYQCHAPDATRQVHSGDDRTPLGVHEGLSCYACHENHSMRTRASCATCHPRLSNCGLDVETMDTTFKSTTEPAQHSFREVHGLPHERHSQETPARRARQSYLVRGLAHRAPRRRYFCCQRWGDKSRQARVGETTSSTSRTFCVSASGVKGFCRKGTPGFNTP